MTQRSMNQVRKAKMLSVIIFASFMLITLRTDSYRYLRLKIIKHLFL